jgi:hypothetical protein
MEIYRQNLSNLSKSLDGKIPAWIYTRSITRNITKALNIDLLGRVIRDGQHLMSILSQVTPSIQS